MNTRRLDLGFYVSLLAASLALDLLLLPALFGNLGAMSEEAGGALMTLMSALLMPLMVLWLVATGLLVTVAVQRRWRAVGRGLVVFLLTGLSAVVLQVMIVTPGWAVVVAAMQGVALVLTVIWTAQAWMAQPRDTPAAASA